MILTNYSYEPAPSGPAVVERSSAIQAALIAIGRRRDVRGLRGAAEGPCSEGTSSARLRLCIAPEEASSPTQK